MTTPPLPASITSAELGALRLVVPRWLPHATAIARAQGFSDDHALRPFADGSNLVAAIGDGHVLKLFAPFLAHQYESERAALAYLHGKLPVAMPALVATGTHQGWPWLIMTRVEGETMESLWPTLDQPTRRDLLRDIGALVAALQRIPVGPLAALEPHWPTFLGAQAVGAHARHLRLGLPAHLLGELDAWLERTQDAIPAPATPAILTGEYTPFNLLLARRGGRWQIGGLIDFGDVMTGFAEYDLLGPIAFSCGGDPTLVRAFLEGHGRPPDPDAFRTRAMRLLLLHRYANLRGQIRIDGWERAPNLDALAELLLPDAALR